MDFAEAWAWILAHKTEIGVGAFLALNLASFITGLTKTPKDDAVVAWIRRVLHRVGFLKHADEPGTLKLPLGGR